MRAKETGSQRGLSCNLEAQGAQEKILQEEDALASILLSNFPFPAGRGLRGWGGNREPLMITAEQLCYYRCRR